MQPALALIEFDSIAAGIEAGDAMAKKAPIARLVAGTVHNGKYLVLISGEVADVEESLAAGLATGASAVLDHVYLPGVHPHVVDAIAAGRRPRAGGSAGRHRDAHGRRGHRRRRCGHQGRGGQPARGAPGRWAGRAWPGLLRWPGRRRGGRRARSARTPLPAPRALIHAVVIPQLHPEMAANLLADTRWRARVHDIQTGRRPHADRRFTDDCTRLLPSHGDAHAGGIRD